MICGCPVVKQLRLEGSTVLWVSGSSGLPNGELPGSVVSDGGDSSGSLGSEVLRSGLEVRRCCKSGGRRSTGLEIDDDAVRRSAIGGGPANSSTAGLGSRNRRLAQQISNCGHV